MGAVSSLVSYDIYREYMNPEATGAQILFVSRVVIVAYGLIMGVFAIILQTIGLNLGWVYSKFIDPQDFDFSTLDDKITLVEEDKRGLGASEQDAVMLRRAERWIKRRGYVLTLVLIVIWPILSIPAGVFTRDYFAFWVLVAIAWGFGAAIIITFLPLIESSEEIATALSGLYYMMICQEAPKAADPNLEEQEAKELAEDSDEPAAEKAEEVAA